MNCPNCNKEVSSDWKTCPYCEYKPILCSKIGCNSGWLPNDAHFCPLCGSPIKGEENLMLKEFIEECVREKINRNPRTIPVQKEQKVSVVDILCTDNTTVPGSAWPVAWKTAIGIVFYVDNSGQHGWAVCLRDQGKYQWSADNHEKEVYGLRKCDNIIVAHTDVDGYYNTKTIRDEGDGLIYPSAYSMGFINGWFLPALGQLKALIDRKKIINTSLGKVGGELLADYGILWSSSQCDARRAWGVAGNGHESVFYKIDYNHVRSVHAF